MDADKGEVAFGQKAGHIATQRLRNHQRSSVPIYVA
jgi:hypothetical protein